MKLNSFNILIVDQHKECRTFIRKISEEYSFKNFVFSIDETANGADTLIACNKKKYDLIFIDVAISGMNSIETTKQIRVKNKKALIVALSFKNDTQSQKKMLTAGAEDYISKPINMDVFTARLNNYLTLILSRKTPSLRHEAKNLFSSLIQTRKTSFFIETDNDLADFWEYFLLNPMIGCNVYSIVHALYYIGIFSLKKRIQPMIWIEESDKYLYFTMEGLDKLHPNSIRGILAKSPEVQDFKITDDKISIRYKREQIISEPIKQPLFEPVNVIPDTEAGMSCGIKENTKTVQGIDSKQIYRYMDEEDVEDIKEYLTRLNTFLLIVGNGDISFQEVEEIAYYLDRIGRSASVYVESYPIARALSVLSTTIEENIQVFIDKSSSLGPFCSTFGLDLMNWVQMMFYDGAPSVNFMDNTIISNAQMIESMLVASISVDEEIDMDDIFDF